MSKKITYIAIAAVLALVSGGIVHMLAPAWGVFVATEFLRPLADRLLGLLIAVASLMVFVGLVNSICSMDNVATFGLVGKKVLKLFVKINLVALLLGGCTGLYFFDVYTGGGTADLQLIKELYGLLLQIIPVNLVDPFVTSNTVQIVFLAVCCGVVLLLLGDKAAGLKKLTAEANAFVLLFIEKVCLLLPLIVYLSLTAMLLSGKYMILCRAWKYLAFSAGMGCLFILFRALWMGYRCHISPFKFLRNYLPIGVLGFTTGSGVACFPIETKLAERDYGVDSKLNMFTFSLGQTIYSPITIMTFWGLVLGMGEIFGIGLSLGQLFIVGLTVLMMATAIPNIPSSALTVLGLIFVQAGLPPEALAIATLTDVFTDMIIAGAEEYCLCAEIILLQGRSHTPEQDLCAEQV